MQKKFLFILKPEGELHPPDKVEERHGVVRDAAALRPPREVVLQHEALRVPRLLLLPAAAPQPRVPDLERPHRVVGEHVFSPLRDLDGSVALHVPVSRPVLITLLLK